MRHERASERGAACDLLLQSVSFKIEFIESFAGVSLLKLMASE